MRILGIDPGLRTTGFGVVEKHGSQLLYVASGTIKTNKEAQGNLAERLKLGFSDYGPLCTCHWCCAATQWQPPTWPSNDLHVHA